MLNRRKAKRVILHELEDGDLVTVDNRNGWYKFKGFHGDGSAKLWGPLTNTGETGPNSQNCCAIPERLKKTVRPPKPVQEV